SRRVVRLAAPDCRAVSVGRRFACRRGLLICGGSVRGRPGGCRIRRVAVRFGQTEQAAQLLGLEAHDEPVADERDGRAEQLAVSQFLEIFPVFGGVFLGEGDVPRLELFLDFDAVRTTRAGIDDDLLFHVTLHSLRQRLFRCRAIQSLAVWPADYRFGSPGCQLAAQRPPDWSACRTRRVSSTLRPTLLSLTT